jgi:flagellar motor switch protein FliM
LQESWRTLLKVDIGFKQRLQTSEATALLSSTAQRLLVNFEVRWQEKKGRLLLALPAVVSTALLRSLVPQEAAPQPAPPEDRGRLQGQLLDCKFEAELLLPRSTVSVRQLYRLAPGDVLVLQVRSSELLPVHVAGRHMFLASPARCGSQRGAQVQRVLSIVPEKEGEERK